MQVHVEAGTVQVDLLDNNERTTHEFRVSSNELNELPFSYTAGVFIEESNLKTQNDYGYLGFLDSYPDQLGQTQLLEVFMLIILILEIRNIDFLMILREMMNKQLILLS